MNKHQNQDRITALLPMKANSTRVKGKNFRELSGKPLFRWVLDTLLDVKRIERIVINTDARNILAEHGLIESERVIIRDRNPDICGDEVSMNRIIEDDIKAIESDIYLMTHTTNPLLSRSTCNQALDRFINAFSSDTADSLFTVNKFQTRFYSKDCKPINHNPLQLIPTQDLEPWYEENSNLYIFTKESFLTTDARIGARPIMYETPYLESIDIDTEDDWKLAVAATKTISI